MKNLNILITTLMVLGISTMLVITSCEGDGGGDGERELAQISASEVQKRTGTDSRDSYVVFSISASQLVTDYHLAVKKAVDAPPTVEEMLSGALKRNLGTEPINVLIAQRLNAPMVAFAKKFFADNEHETLGPGMLLNSRHPDVPDYALIRDADASGSDAWVTQSVLEPSTEYKLYGMEKDGGSVSAILTLTTDAESSSVASVDNVPEYVDTTLENEHIDIAIHTDEIYIFPMQNKLSSSNTILGGGIYYSGQISGNTVVATETMALWGTPDSGLSGQLLLFTQKDTNIETLKTGMYTLMQTARIVLPEEPVKPLHFGKTYIISGQRTPDVIRFSYLRGRSIESLPSDAPTWSTETGATTIGYNSVSITWGTPYAGYISDNDLPGTISGYKIYQSTADITASTDLTTLDLVESSDTEATMTGLSEGTEYFFAIKTKSDAGESALSKVMKVIANAPGAPTGITRTSGDGEVTITWVAPLNAGYINGDGTVGTISVYKIYQSTTYITPSTDLNALTVTSSSSSPKTVTGLDNGTLYHFAVTATNATGEGILSVPRPAIPRPVTR